MLAQSAITARDKTAMNTLTAELAQMVQRKMEPEEAGEGLVEGQADTGSTHVFAQAESTFRSDHASPLAQHPDSGVVRTDLAADLGEDDDGLFELCHGALGRPPQT